MEKLDIAYELVFAAMEELENKDSETYLLLEEALGYIAEVNEEMV